MAVVPFSVHELDELRLPLAVRRRVRRLTRSGRAGVVLGAIMTPGRRRPTSLDPTVSLRGNGIRLELSNQHSRRSVARGLAAGGHGLTLRAWRATSESFFEYGIELADGDVFVAVARPIQPWTLFGPRRESDEWYLGVV
ncbi:hypothetical protein [Kutzneria sp. NPDC051319]|uniref:hypothetical protein n=1 Tax=Kutzneria sp. NPDC051319 TaxID=3155047 RepID=UPI003412B3B2